MHFFVCVDFRHFLDMSAQEQELYQKEGLGVNEVHYVDNQDCIGEFLTQAQFPVDPFQKLIQKVSRQHRLQNKLQCLTLNISSWAGSKWSQSKVVCQRCLYVPPSCALMGSGKRSVEWHPGTSLTSVAFETLYCNTQSALTKNPHTSHVQRLVQGETSTHPCGVRAATMYLSVGTKIPTSHYCRDCHIHVCEGSKRNKYLWVLWRLLYYMRLGRWYPLAFVVPVLK